MKRFQFRRRVPGHSPLQVIWWDVCECFVRAYLLLFHRCRFEGVENVPEEGPCLFISNHESYLDPMLNGCAIRDRQFTAIARESLFTHWFMGRLLRSLGAVPIKEEGADGALMRLALSELAAGRCVLIYPEGSRTADGSMTRFKRGVALLLRRGRSPVLPMAVAGAYEAWPRWRRWPKLGTPIVVRVGKPIPHDELMRDGPEAALARLEQEVARLRDEAHASRGGRTACEERSASSG